MSFWANYFKVIIREYTEIQEKAFEEVKRIVSNSPLMKFYNPKESLALESDTLQNSEETTLMHRECLKVLMSCYFLVNEWERISARPLKTSLESFIRSVRTKKAVQCHVPSTLLMF